MSCWFQCCRTAFTARMSTLSFRLQTPSSSQKQTAAAATAGTLKHCRANPDARCEASCSLKHITAAYELDDAFVVSSHSWTFLSRNSEIREQHLRRLDVTAAAQLLDEEGGVGEGWSAMTEVVEIVQVVFQSEPLDQLRAGEMRQL